MPGGGSGQAGNPGCLLVATQGRAGPATLPGLVFPSVKWGSQEPSPSLHGEELATRWRPLFCGAPRRAWQRQQETVFLLSIRQTAEFHLPRADTQRSGRVCSGWLSAFRPPGWTVDACSPPISLLPPMQVAPSALISLEVLAALAWGDSRQGRGSRGSLGKQRAAVPGET